ncbi:methylmalonyl-CoA mutase [Vulcanimicrobium alpinum]|uniref:Methylmalonyl-CoA mutase n=1 Tax=Vulcanimicrobium alpinum TaxID=3016050 RepID=A0AAN2C8J2_UNVUL|nr:methylmalonyl-CoA mutase [Vulcanimicrobium alpinum]
MQTPEKIRSVAGDREQWEQLTLLSFMERRPEARPVFRTLGGLPHERVYTPEHIALDYGRDLGFPGAFPYTRGPYPTMYRAQPWTMRQIAGFGTADDTNARFRYLIAQGQTGISTDFDMPTLMGYDSDDVRSEGEVGREGVAIDSVDDMHDLYADIDLEKISVSMTINPSAWILFAMYLTVADERGFDRNKLSGTIQNDIIKEYVSQKEWVYPPRPAMRIVRDSIVYSTQNLPRYNPVNVSGYHTREAGSTAIQEVAFTLAAGMAYVEDVVRAGVDVDDFAPRLSFFFVSQIDFLEEVAKFRAARRVWARLMKERFGAKKAESMRLRFHCQTAGVSCTAREPLNNIARTAIEGLAAVLGGAQSLHTNGYDEALSIPSEAAMKIALRTQQIIAEETGVVGTIDPLAGSYAVESLTNRIEQGCFDYFAEIDKRGGVVKCIEDNFFQIELADAAYDLHRRKDAGERHVVGVTKYRDDSANPHVELHHVDEGAANRQLARLAKTRAKRDGAAVQRALDEIVRVAQTDENIMPSTLAAVKARATGGEIINALRPVFGTYVETPVF